MPSAERWFAVTVTVAGAREDEAAGYLLDVFPQGLAVEGRLTPPAGADVLARGRAAGDEVRLTGYLDSPPAPALLAAIEDRLAPCRIAVEPLHHLDFARAFRERFTRLEVLPGFVVTAQRQGRGPEELWLEPGLVFGTGDHPSTRLALRGMAPALRPGCKVADVGTGTGILALFAARSGCEVVAYDTDPQAVRAARRHARGNGLPLCVRHGTVDPRDGPFDLVVANIVAEVLMGLREELLASLGEHGLVVLSGIVRAREDDVRRAFAPLHLRWRGEEGEWLALALGKE